MKINAMAVVAVAALGGGMLLGSAVLGQDGKGGANPGAEMQKKMMEAWQAYSTPGEYQSQLAKRVGSWHIRVRQWPMPGAPVMESRGVAEYEMTMDGRFLEQEFEGEFDGIPFEGFGISGHNNKTGKYQFCWIDNMATGMMMGSGTVKNDMLEWTASTTNPMTGEHMMRGTETYSNPNQFTSTFYGPGPDGREFKMMELVYTRQSDAG